MVSQKIGKLFKALDSASVMISSEASVQNASWPFVTIDHWSKKAEKLVELGEIGESLLAIAPIVQPNVANNWTAYVQQQAPAWYQASIDHEASNETLEDLLSHTIPYIHTYGVDSSRPVPADLDLPSTPIWQSYPLQKGEILSSIQKLPTNYDIRQGLDTNVNILAVADASVFPALSFPSIPPSENIFQRTAKTTILQPIFEEVDSDYSASTMVAFLYWQIDWSVVLGDILESGVTGILAVVRTSCSKQVSFVTYRLNGPKSILISDTDLHMPEFDDMEVVQALYESTTTVSDECIPNVSIHLYPTKDFRDKFVSQNGLYYSGVVVLIFCFTTVVFLVYDFLVRQRQRKVMDRIQRQDMIVSDVFPSAIRDRLYNQNMSTGHHEKDHLLDPIDLGASSMFGSAPLADLFPNTTVIFADIVGFTAWSSAREPSQVFILLETIYSAFDKIAYRQGVFKVETVGDCYVAVAGLPEPDEEHAVAACKFAKSCLKKMKEITLKLEVSLGPDTADLGLRVGIHRYVCSLA